MLYIYYAHIDEILVLGLSGKVVNSVLFSYRRHIET